MSVKKNLTKRNLIDKADTRMLVYAGVAAFIVVFALISCKSLISQLNYQNRLANAKQTALNQLKSDITAESVLGNSYKKFVSTTTNIIGGSSTGQGLNGGDNGQIILDALPSKYDFPATITSVNKLLGLSGVTVESISGTDEQVIEEFDQSSPTPTPVPIVFQFTASGSYQNIQNLFETFQDSIRPMQFENVTISASSNSAKSQTSLTLVATAQTYYQPEKVFDLTSEVVQ